MFAQSPINFNKTRRKGITLIEMLIACSITACLMTAVAVAMYSSITSYRENQQEMHSNENALALLDIISRQIRTSTSCSFTVTTESSDINGQTISGTVSVTTLIINNPQDSGGLEQVKYVFYPAYGNYSGRIYYCYQAEGGSMQVQSMPLMGYTSGENVTAMDITTQTNLETGAVENVKIEITVSLDGKIRQFSRSCARRSGKL